MKMMINEKNIPDTNEEMIARLKATTVPLVGMIENNSFDIDVDASPDGLLRISCGDEIIRLTNEEILAIKIFINTVKLFDAGT